MESLRLKPVDLKPFLSEQAFVILVPGSFLLYIGIQCSVKDNRQNWKLRTDKIWYTNYIQLTDQQNHIVGIIMAYCYVCATAVQNAKKIWKWNQNIWQKLTSSQIQISEERKMIERYCRKHWIVYWLQKCIMFTTNF